MKSNNSNMQPLVLIADEMHPSLLPMLSTIGLEGHYRPLINRSEMCAILGDYAGLVIRSKTKVDETLLQFGTQLRFVARAGAGLDLVDAAAVQRRNIKLFQANAGNCDTVAEHAVALLLALLTNLVRADRQVRQKIWDREANRGFELMHKTVGIIGYGHNGQATAKRLSGFGCRVLCFDKYRDDYADAYAQAVSMPQIMAQADVISLHVPLNDDTRQLVNDRFIDSAAKPFYLLNCARGEIVELEALVRGLENGKIRGAGLDVLENEKLGTLTPTQGAAFGYLCASDNVLLTPHVAGWSHESYQRINQVLVAQIAASVTNRPFAV